MELQSANLCFLKFSLAICSYQRLVEIKLKIKETQACGSPNISLIFPPPSLFRLEERRWEKGSEFLSCCLVLSRKKKKKRSFLHLAEGLENPEVFTWKSKILGLHATLEQKLSAELTHLWVPFPSLSTNWMWLQRGAVVIRATWSSSNPTFPIYLWDILPPLCLGSLPWQMSLIYY